MNTENEPQIPFAIVIKSAKRKFLKCGIQTNVRARKCERVGNAPNQGEVAFCFMVLLKRNMLGILLTLICAAGGYGIASSLIHDTMECQTTR